MTTDGERRAKRERLQQLLDRTYELQLDFERLRSRLRDTGMTVAADELGTMVQPLQWLIRALNERMEAP